MGRIFAGVLIIVGGVLVLLNAMNLPVPSIDDLFALYFWPVVMIFIGLSFLRMRHHFSWGKFVTGLVFIGLGIVFLGNHLHWFNIEVESLWKFFWPLLLIVIGLNILSGPKSKRKHKPKTLGPHTAQPTESTIQDAAPPAPKPSSTWTLKDDEYWAVFGKVDIDLRNASIPDGETVLQVTSVFGNIEVRVPVDLPVICEGTAVFGSLHLLDKEHGGIVTSVNAQQGSTEGAVKWVKINCNSVFGNVEVSAF